MLNSSFTSFFATLAFINTALSLPVTDLLPPPVKRADTTPRLIQYVQTFHPADDEDAHLSILPLLNKDTGITHVILAALHINGPDGNITLNDENPNATTFDRTWEEAATLQQNGVKVMVMMGGAATGSYDGRLCSTNGRSIQDAYYLPLVSTLKYRNVDGIDLDIEEPVALSCAQNLIRRIRQDFGKDFIITMAPVASDLPAGGSGLSGFSYSRLERSRAGKLVNWYNGQYYSGFVQGSLEESYQAGVANGFKPERVVLGVLDSSNDGSGYVSLSDVKETIENLKEDYRKFGGVDGWEYFDAGADEWLSKPWQWTKQIGKALFGKTEKRDVQVRERKLHTPKLPGGVAALMAKGHDQITAARALRMAKGDEVEAERMLKEGS
ncbi:uncharacterized protein LTR77_001632 [Saxophila tyrrhenica]|uniref:chitinase n=1 Tax=Saxophila tyrrhenica TaxID=1690608 RepID=A0AAV9PP43_9PEZI|nr:hypothetical protein LTR77_001632 [Saxophila tyrrhenica]